VKVDEQAGRGAGREGIQVSMERSSRGEFERPQITGWCRKEGFAGGDPRKGSGNRRGLQRGGGGEAGRLRRTRRKRRGDNGGGRGRENEHRYRQVGRRRRRVKEGAAWQAADAERDMLYDVCSSHRPSLIN
jgi:hypothetical protein